MVVAGMAVTMGGGATRRLAMRGQYRRDAQHAGKFPHGLFAGAAQGLHRRAALRRDLDAEADMALAQHQPLNETRRDDISACRGIGNARQRPDDLILGYAAHMFGLFLALAEMLHCGRHMIAQNDAVKAPALRVASDCHITADTRKSNRSILFQSKDF